MGGTRGEQQALLTYWHQRIAVTNAHGVVKVVKARMPFCAGDHLHAQPHHFGYLHQVAPPPLKPRQHPPHAWRQVPPRRRARTRPTATLPPRSPLPRVK